ncbi:asparaginase [Cypionkella psychrotolerans]|uniref:asparaginase n=1 Tax=Cypionkella psychrotolerans TaxID=1678131 RepID=UPI0006B4F224|nr:asparaginase [Cypionkella psychrotolerans]
MAAAEMVELWRGGLLESTHRGHAVICDEKGEVVQAWGDPGRVIFPRSSCKMLQALPLLESGAAEAAGLTDAHIALSCASHQGSALHVNMASRWLADLGLGEPDLRCGAHEPYDRAERDRLIIGHEAPCQLHNNCSGKHSGFLTTTRHLKAGPEYVELDHPLQKAIKAATEEVTGEASAGYGIDGCSAPNFAMSVAGLARGMAKFASAAEAGSTRDRAMHRLTRSMAAHPELVAGEGRACTELMRAMGGRVAIKTGAEAVFVAIIPEKKLGIALKIEDGNSRASEAALVAILAQLGVLDASHPMAQKRLPAPQTNCRGLTVGELRLASGFL